MLGCCNQAFAARGIVKLARTPADGWPLELVNRCARASLVRTRGTLPFQLQGGAGQWKFSPILTFNLQP